jgi:hypothetical protein
MGIRDVLNKKIGWVLVGGVAGGIAFTMVNLPIVEAREQTAGIASARNATSIILPNPVAGATGGPSMAIDSSGRVHVAHEATLTGEVIYATCAANCGAAANWVSVQVGSNGALGGNPVLRLTSSGQPRLMYVGQASGLSDPSVLVFNACDSNCASAASWTELPITTNVVVSDADFFALDSQGRPRAILPDANNQRILTLYACDTGCAANVTNWSATPLGVVGQRPALIFDGADGAHLLYAATDSAVSASNDVLTYGACAQDCLNPANWAYTYLFLIARDLRASYSLDADSNNRPRIAFFTGALVTNTPAEANVLIYGWCNSACTDGNNWDAALVGVAANDGVSPDLLMDGNDRPLISYYNDASGFELGYADCSANCESSAGAWTIEKVESPLGYPSQPGPGCPLSDWFITGPISLALSPAGAPQIAFVARNVQFCNNVNSEKLRQVRYLDLGQAAPPTPTPTPSPSVTPTPQPTATPTGQGRFRIAVPVITRGR